MARASSAPKVSPITPRMSYSRRTVGSKVWLKRESSVAVGQLAEQHVARGVRLVHRFVRATAIGVDGRDQPPVRFEDLGSRCLIPHAQHLARMENGLRS